MYPEVILLEYKENKLILGDILQLMEPLKA